MSAEARPVEHETRPTLSVAERRAVLDRVLMGLKKRFYAPEKLDQAWYAVVESRRAAIETAPTEIEFEREMNSLLKELRASHLGFFHGSARTASSRAAISANYLEDETDFGRRWIFQDVHVGGSASAAGVKSGDVLLRVNGRDIYPPEHPVFAMGEETRIELSGADGLVKEVKLVVARPKGKKLHFVEPTLVLNRKIDQTGYLKVAMFPGMIGVDVANEISLAVAELGNVSGLIIDLRGNTGGGLGALRVMSLLTPDRLPVGFAIEKSRVPPDLNASKKRFRRFGNIPEKKASLWLIALKFGRVMVTREPIVLQTEGLGARPFHGRIVLLVDRHTASAAEMIVAFAKENRLATVVGEATAGRLLSATSMKVGNGYRLALPTGAYYTWNGALHEGTPIPPDYLVEFDWRAARVGDDAQLQTALRLLSEPTLNPGAKLTFDS